MIATDRAPDLATVAALLPAVWETGLKATSLLRDTWDPSRGTPVFTEAGTYTTRGWTEWTQGFQFGNMLYLYEATGERAMLEAGRRGTLTAMAPHLTHTGVHDHGFNNVSTYGNLLRMMAEQKIPYDRWEAQFYRLALKVSGAVQASRWTATSDGGGFVHSFNGAHSLFSDTIRSMRALALAHQLGHVLMGEQDRAISLVDRLFDHAASTAHFNVYYGQGRDGYDVRGRVVHESIFNTANGVYRCASTQQGYSPFSTWTRGLAWVLAGYPEELEWLRDRGAAVAAHNRIAATEREWIRTACATADFHLTTTPPDGVPYWDTGAPGLDRSGAWQEQVADPFTVTEPVDSSAAAIAAQGLLRLGTYLVTEADRLAQVELDLDGNGAAVHNAAAIKQQGARYRAAALVTARTLFSEPYLNSDPTHQGILLHSIYHQPNRWDYVPAGSSVPYGESCMWGDYHLLELALMVQREADGKAAQRFFDIDVPGDTP